jgi:nucleoside-diphosphate-sugar epimerase
VAESGYLNLIHIDDAANVIVEADKRGRTPRMFVVSDGHPVQRRAYYVELSRLLGAGRPQFVAPAADSPAASRSESSKRINNARLVAELDVRLAYPSFREGLAAIIAAENAGNA